MNAITKPSKKLSGPHLRPWLIDFFSGCGGTSLGFQAAGIGIAAGIDNDPDSAKTFQQNFLSSSFIEEDIRTLSIRRLSEIVERRRPAPIIFSACAPCQPFSKQRRKTREDDDRAPLLLAFLKYVEKLQPDCLFIENVPGMQRGLESESPFHEFRQRATDTLGYHFTSQVVSSASYGVPQKRRRLIALASKHGPIEVPHATHGPGTSNPTYATVKDWIYDLPPIAAGEEHKAVANHRASGLSEINLRRIRATPEGGGREDWPEDLKLKCHTNGYKGHSDVYGRMAWDEPATGLTTRCISLSNGRFGHPAQDRAISVREAACLQTFPRSFTFTGSWESMGRQIGNAVPVLLAEQFGLQIVSHLKTLASPTLETA
jgi:DNA (cytosine-5)-methyltransferase 1